MWPEERGLRLDFQTTAPGFHDLALMLIVSSRLFLRILALLLASLACYSSLALSFSYSCYSSSYCLSWPLQSVSHPPSRSQHYYLPKLFSWRLWQFFFISQGTSINSSSNFLISTVSHLFISPDHVSITAHLLVIPGHFLSPTILLLCLLCHTFHLPRGASSEDIFFNFFLISKDPILPFTR